MLITCRLQRSCNSISLIISYFFGLDFLSISILARSSFIDGLDFELVAASFPFFLFFFLFSFLRIPPVAIIEQFGVINIPSFPTTLICLSLVSKLSLSLSSGLYSNLFFPTSSSATQAMGVVADRAVRHPFHHAFSFSWALRTITGDQSWQAPVGRGIKPVTSPFLGAAAWTMGLGYSV